MTNPNIQALAAGSFLHPNGSRPTDYNNLPTRFCTGAVHQRLNILTTTPEIKGILVCKQGLVSIIAKHFTKRKPTVSVCGTIGTPHQYTPSIITATKLLSNVPCIIPINHDGTSSVDPLLPSGPPIHVTLQNHNQN